MSYPGASKALALEEPGCNTPTDAAREPRESNQKGKAAGKCGERKIPHGSTIISTNRYHG